MLYYLQHLEFVQPNSISRILPSISFPHSNVFSDELQVTTLVSPLEHKILNSDQVHAIVENSVVPVLSLRTRISRSLLEDRERLRDKAAGYYSARNREQLRAYVNRTEVLLRGLKRDTLFPDEDPVTGSGPARLLNQLMHSLLSQTLQTRTDSGAEQLLSILVVTGLRSVFVPYRAGRATLRDLECPVDACTLTEDTRQLFTADALLWENSARPPAFRELDTLDADIEFGRPSNQVSFFEYIQNVYKSLSV